MKTLEEKQIEIKNTKIFLGVLRKQKQTPEVLKVIKHNEKQLLKLNKKLYE